MSVNLLNKFRRAKIADEHHRYQWWFLLALPVWVAFSFFAVQFVLIGVIWILRFFGISLRELFDPTILEVVLAGLTYILTLAAVIGIPYLVRKRRTSFETLGLQRLLTWTDIGLTPLAYIAYMVVLGIAIYVVMEFIPSFPLDQEQDVGFRALSSGYEYFLAFMTLVVIGPIAEETLFRGYLYGKLRGHVPIYAAMMVTALLFALAHGQWNVALDTFILSIILTGLREITGSIWAGILVHMVKNTIAFCVLFVSPFMFGM